jgi:hypothetical protein
MTLCNFSDVPSPIDELQIRLDRIRTLLHRLNRVRDSAVEAEVITQLTLETEAVRRARAAVAAADSEARSRASDPTPAEGARSNNRSTRLPVARK